MKKVIVLGATILTTGLVNSASASNWYAGLGLGWKTAGYKGEGGFSDTARAGLWGFSKTKFSQSSALGSLFAGSQFSFDPCNLFVEANIAMDQQKTEKKNLSNSSGGTTAPEQIFIRRSESVGLDLGVQKNWVGMDIAFKVGAVFSRFALGVQRTDSTAPASKGQQWAAGFAPGVKIEKKTGPVSIGIKYEYQMYGRVQYQATDVGLSTDQMVRGNPRYHVVSLTVKKDF